MVPKGTELPGFGFLKGACSLELWAGQARASAGGRLSLPPALPASLSHGRPGFSAPAFPGTCGHRSRQSSPECPRQPKLANLPHIPT